MYYRVFPSISPAGWVAYPTETSFHVENLLSGEQHDYPPLYEPPTKYWNKPTFFWDDSGQYALLSDGNLWALDCASGTLSLLRENWEFGDGYYFAERPTWSPDSNRAILLDMNDGVYSFNRSDGVLAELAIDIGGHFLDAGWYWLDDWRLVVYGTAEWGISIYDFESSSTQRIGVQFSPYAKPRLSSDGRYLAFVEDGPVIYDTATATYQRMRPDYRSFNSVTGGEIAWNDTDDWLLVFDDALVAGGAYVRYLDIMRADGTLRRDLSFSWSPNAITLNWLPPQVDPAALPPPVKSPLFPQPERTLHGSQWSFYADWSPDGRWLAAGLGWGSGGAITLWEIDTGEIVHVFEDAAEDERVVWPTVDEFVPALIIPDSVLIWRNEHILASSPDGRQQVKNVDNATVVVDSHTGDMLAKLNNLSEWEPVFTSAAFSPDGHWLVAVTPYRPIQFWRTDTFESLPIPRIPGQAVAFSPDGTQLAVTASWDVQIWDIATLLGTDVQ